MSPTGLILFGQVGQGGGCRAVLGGHGPSLAWGTRPPSVLLPLLTDTSRPSTPPACGTFPGCCVPGPELRTTGSGAGSSLVSPQPDLNLPEVVSGNRKDVYSYPHPGLDGHQSNPGPPADGALSPCSEDGEWKTRRRDGFRSATIHKVPVVKLKAAAV